MRRLSPIGMAVIALFVAGAVLVLAGAGYVGGVLCILALLLLAGGAYKPEAYGRSGIDRFQVRNRMRARDFE